MEKRHFVLFLFAFLAYFVYDSEFLLFVLKYTSYEHSIRMEECTNHKCASWRTFAQDIYLLYHHPDQKGSNAVLHGPFSSYRPPGPLLTADICHHWLGLLIYNLIKMERYRIYCFTLTFAHILFEIQPCLCCIYFYLVLFFVLYYSIVGLYPNLLVHLTIGRHLHIALVATNNVLWTLFYLSFGMWFWGHF